MEKTGWKVTALIFMGLFFLLLISIIWLMSLGLQMDAAEMKCANEVCFGVDSDSYYFDPYSNLCQCIKGDEVAHQEIID